MKFYFQLLLWLIKQIYWLLFNFKVGFRVNISGWKKYFDDLFFYNQLERVTVKNLRPITFDAVSHPLDPIYFYQSVWCARKIYKAKPKIHHDIGSNINFVGIISQFIPVIMIDLRPVGIVLDNFKFVHGDILNLPYQNNSVRSLSSLCVLEHIGLGRYGDKIDHGGTIKAMKEIKRVLAHNGNLYVSLPVDTNNTVYFNAHRAFTRDTILEMFSGLELMEEKYIYKQKLFDRYDKNKGFGTGLYHFRKR